MKPQTLTLLACSSCRSPFGCNPLPAAGELIVTACLTCVGCGLAVPVVRGFPVFPEARLHAGLWPREELDALAQRLFGSEADFEAGWRQRCERGALEPYAAFHPFNESTRALSPLLPSISATLNPGDAIVDLWCRTGWGGEWLAGLFPEQHVVAVWEGAYSVLGYKGYAHLLGETDRASNLDVVFAAASQPLPFRSGAFAFTYSHDALHRHPWVPFASESLRIGKPDGVCVHAHLHLSNGEPDPYFDRGGRILHGRDYQQWANRTATGRHAYVLGEADLFEDRIAWPQCSTPDTDCYNALLMVTPDAPGATTVALESSASGDTRWIRHPLFELDLHRSQWRRSPVAWQQGFCELLPRHPVYAKRLPQAPLAIDSLGVLVSILAAAGLSTDQIGAAVGAGDTRSRLTELVSQDLLLGARVTRAGVRLQDFHALRAPLPAQALTHSDELIRLPNGQGLFTSDLALLAQALLHALKASPDDAVVCFTGPEEPLITVLAVLAASLGREAWLVDDPAQWPQRFAMGVVADECQHPTTMPSLRLGLDGAPGTLLGQLGDSPPAPLPPLQATGSLGFSIGGKVRVCQFTDLRQGLWALCGTSAQSPLLLDDLPPVSVALEIIRRCLLD